MPSRNAMARWTLALAAALIGALLALPAEAQWKWRDKSGQTQYSDLPPPLTVPEQDILSKPSGARGRTSPAQAAAAAQAALAASGAASAPAVASASAPKTVESDLESKRAKAEADQAAKVKADEI